jgi:hypothetical protein
VIEAATWSVVPPHLNLLIHGAMTLTDGSVLFRLFGIAHGHLQRRLTAPLAI